ncbi:MAG: hypothetical protein Q8M07_29795 [Prosthecobacter sp.]|nr:hypothetical protein [Prosthecobacter sp.]
MIEITFGRIEAGWAETRFDFGHASLTVDISWEGDPFRDLADLGLRLMKQESPLEMHFTDEEFTFALHCELRAWKYHVTLECDGASNFDRPRDPQCLTCEEDPREFATMLWRELSRMSQNPEARNFLVFEGCEERFRWHFPDDKIAELEQALMG